MKKEYYCNPLNLEYRYQFYRQVTQGEEKGPFKVYREAADPSLILFKDTYFLFPSMTAGFFTSENLVTWNFNEFKQNMPVYDYAPDVRAMGDYMYFSASHRGEPCDFYRTKDPRTEEFERIPGTFEFWDPNLFIDDDQRVYFYWGCSNQEPIYGVELDPETMHPLTEKKALIDSHSDIRGYERVGEDHIPVKTEEQIDAEAEQMYKSFMEMMGISSEMSEEEAKEMVKRYIGNRPFIEGAWMTKHDGIYYLQYAIPGTEYNVYGDGVYISENPLGPFRPAKNNPYSYVPGGFITGAGHGSTLEDKSGNWWHIASMRISHNEAFERRLGLWKAGFDQDGELYCDQRFADWPIAMDAKPFAKPEQMLLSYKKTVTVSSGVHPENVTDENIRTMWKANTNQPGEWILLDLGEVMEVSSVQINFGDDGMTVELPEELDIMRLSYEERWIDTKKQETSWILEASKDGENYEVVEDTRGDLTDYAHAFVQLPETKSLRYFRLTIEHVPYDRPAVVSGIRVFGKKNGEICIPACNVRAEYDGNMDMKVSWDAQDNTGAVVVWGHQSDKLYHSRMVYGTNETNIGALVKNQEIYLRVDTFNEVGVAEGTVIKIK